MRFGYDVAFQLCLLPKPHNNSLMEPTSTLTIFFIELMGGVCNPDVLILMGGACNPDVLILVGGACNPDVLILMGGVCNPDVLILVGGVCNPELPNYLLKLHVTSPIHDVQVIVDFTIRYKGNIFWKCK